MRAEAFFFSPASTGRLAATLVSLIANRMLALPPDDELLDELRPSASWNVRPAVSA